MLAEDCVQYGINQFAGLYDSISQFCTFLVCFLSQKVIFWEPIKKSNYKTDKHIVKSLF